ncbi:Plasmodium exported protein (hyp10), unknown function [Plasmodium reichenowi]|uniref:Uncharacterized protein n=1 Tax=Plasmodium reichenowi TaxID=5854 RepID=A0A2P9DSR8_PLARE|nr:Plasmodium exported protein (hyp10), unknown function [Plasmodium reichenowi]
MNKEIRSCNYFKLSFFNIVLCILIITHKFCLEQISHNKKNTVDIINAGYNRLLAESQERNESKTHSSENLFTHPIDNKLEEIVTKCHKTSSKSTLNHEIQQKYDNEIEQKECKNEKNNESSIQKFHKKSPYNKLKTISKIALIIIFWQFSILYYILRYIYNKNKKYIHTDQAYILDKNTNGINEKKKKK